MKKIHATHRDKAWLLMPVFLFLSSCANAPTRTFVHPNTDFPAYKRVAILPFDNLTEEDFAGGKVTNIFVTEFMKSSGMEVVEPSLVLSALDEMGALPEWGAEEPVGVSTETLQELGKKLGVQAILAGAVDQYGDVRIGGETYPVVAVSVKLLDAETGTVIWRASKQARGGPGIPFVGFGESYTRVELAQKVCQEIVQSVIREIQWSRGVPKRKGLFGFFYY